MASILSLIAGLVVGVTAGWLLRGRQIARTPSAEAVVPAQATGSVSAEKADAEEKVPALVGATSEAAVVPAPAPAPAAETIPEPEPVVVVVPEPAVVATTVVEPEPEPATSTAVAEPVAADADAVAEPVAAEPVVAEPAVVQIVAEPDDLTKIAGIGPKMAMALAASGITTFEQLAATALPDIRAAVTAAGMRLAPSAPSWADQAKKLAG